MRIDGKDRRGVRDEEFSANRMSDALRRTMWDEGGSMIMEYAILVTVFAMAVVFAATWLTGWDGDSEHGGSARFDYAGEFQQQKGIGPELKGMYQRVHAGIALPSP